MGFPTPTTYSPLSRDLYEEGLMLPCVRVQRDWRDLDDVIDICCANIRAPDQFRGDYLATLAAVRTGERAMQALCAEHGVPVVPRGVVDEHLRRTDRVRSAEPEAALTPWSGLHDPSLAQADRIGRRRLCRSRGFGARAGPRRRSRRA